MSDEELKELFRKYDTLTFFYVIVLFILITVIGAILEVRVDKLQSILCEQHQVESCK